MDYYLKALTNYVQFNGRARRKEFWFFALPNAIISYILYAVGILIHFGFLQSIFCLAIMLPSIGVGIRRMHDVGKSGWFVLIPIYSLVLACTEGVHGDNQYGQDPKNEVAGQYTNAEM